MTLEIWRSKHMKFMKWLIRNLFRRRNMIIVFGYQTLIWLSIMKANFSFILTLYLLSMMSSMLKPWILIASLISRKCRCCTLHEIASSRIVFVGGLKALVFNTITVQCSTIFLLCVLRRLNIFHLFSNFLFCLPINWVLCRGRMDLFHTSNDKESLATSILYH